MKTISEIVAACLSEYWTHRFRLGITIFYKKYSKDCTSGTHILLVETHQKCYPTSISETFLAMTGMSLA